MPSRTGTSSGRSIASASRPRSAMTTSTARATSSIHGASSSATLGPLTRRSCSCATWTSTRSPRSVRRGNSFETGGRTRMRISSDLRRMVRDASRQRCERPGRKVSMQFGFTLKPENTIERTIALTRQAEAAGFAHGWLFDSHVLWRDPYPLLTLMAEATDALRLGTCVTNPGTREPSVTASSLATLDELSDGRMDLGIGRGDSARRVLGKRPTTIATLEEAIRVIRALVAGESIAYEGTDLHFPWTQGWELPVWVAGYGPMALAMTGRVADGLILQLGDPDLIAWLVGQVREAEA